MNSIVHLAGRRVMVLALTSVMPFGPFRVSRDLAALDVGRWSGAASTR